MGQIILRSWGAICRAGARTFRPPADGRLSNVSVFPKSLASLVVLCAIAAITYALMVLVDEPVARAVRETDRNSFLWFFFQWLTHLGTSGWVLVISGAIGVFLSFSLWGNAGQSGTSGPKASHSSVRKNFGRYTDANFVFFTVALSGISASVIKNTIGRARPKHLDQFGHLHFEFAAFESSFASFPSGHSTTFGALAMALFLLFPKHRVLIVLFGIFGGASRVVVGAHYPSDVFAGLLFGAAFVVLCARYLAKRRLAFKLNRIGFPIRQR